MEFVCCCAQQHAASRYRLSARAEDDEATAGINFLSTRTARNIHLKTSSMLHPAQREDEANEELKTEDCFLQYQVTFV